MRIVRNSIHYKISVSYAILILYYLSKVYVNKYPEESLGAENTTMKSSVSLVTPIDTFRMDFALKWLKSFK